MTGYALPDIESIPRPEDTARLRYALPDVEPILYRPEDAARVLGIGRSKLFELLATGQVPSVQIGRARRVSRRALENYAERMEQPTAESPSTPAA